MRTPMPADIVTYVERNLLGPPPLATFSLDRPDLILPRPAVSHADWRGIPDLALTALFLHLPVPDILRLGYLFGPRWLEVWRRVPLYLHDRQFESLPRSDAADAITNALEEYVGGVEDEGVPQRRRIVASFRVDSTEWRPDHAARWCAALERGRVSQVVLFNRGFGDLPRVHIRVPPGLLRCATLRSLHLGFFTVEAGELDALTGATDLGLHGCGCRGDVVAGVLAACRILGRLSVQYGVLDSVVVRSASRRLSSLLMLNTASHSLTVEDAHNLRELSPGFTDVLSIRLAPNLASLMHLNLPNTTLKIDGTEIELGSEALSPRMRSVRALSLDLHYTALRGMEEHMVPRVVKQMLVHFPKVTNLAIERKDDVPEEEGVASLDDPNTHGHLNVFDFLNLRTVTFSLSDFRGGKAEIALAKALMGRFISRSPKVRLSFDINRSEPEHRHAEEACEALRQFAASRV